MPSLDTLSTKSKKTPSKKPSKDEFLSDTQASSKAFKKIASDYGCTEDEFHLAFANTIDETPEELEKIIQKLIDDAKGFLDKWGAYFLMAHRLQEADSFQINKLRNECKKFLIIENKLPRKEGQKIVKVDSKKPIPKKAPKKKGKPQLSAKLKEKAKDIGMGEPVIEEESTSKKKPLKVKEEISIKPITRQRKKSFICIFNGGEGSGKSRMAQTFPNPFTIDLEDKLFDLIEYDPTLNLQEGNINNLQPDDQYVVAVVFDENSDIDYVQTDENIEKAVNWFQKEGWKTHDTLIIDVGKAIRESAIRAEEFKKGRQLGQVEYIPITKSNKSLLIPLIHFCRQNGRNLVIITHWSGIYETRKNLQGYDESVKIGREPDVKEWLRDLVTWRIDFLKPDESGFDEKFIVDFQKAPGEQYFKLDITNKNLFEIISDPERLDEEKEVFRQMRRKALLLQKAEEKK